MSTSEAHRAGITPYVIRLAAYYAAQGVGEYYPKGYPWFDLVKVSLLMPWTESIENPMASTQVLTVEFFQGSERKRYVEFAMVPAGFGGEPIMKQVR